MATRLGPQKWPLLEVPLYLQILFWLFGIKVGILNVKMNTAKYFDKNSKKRDLSGDSNPEEERKKIRDGSSASTTDNCDVFKEGLGSPECKGILFNCLRNLQEKVTEIFNLRRIQEICRSKVTSN